MSALKKVDFSERCRLCLCAGGQKLHLFESRDRDLLSKIKNCTNLLIKEDDVLPKGLCESCATKIEEFSAFLDKCTKTESVLKINYSNLSVSDQLKCQKKVNVGQAMENKSNNNSLGPKKSGNSSDEVSAVHSFQSLSNPVQSGCVQIVNNKNGQHQNSFTYKTPEVHGVDKDDFEINVHSSSDVISITVEPDVNCFAHKPESVPSDSAIALSPQCNKGLENQDETEMFSQVSTMNYGSSSLIKGPTNWRLPKFACDICKKTFGRKPYLVKHKIIHTGERPFICDVCSKSFIRKEHLVRHKLGHSDQQLHECEFCPKHYVRKDRLNNHQLVTHGVKGPLVCEICGKSFKVKSFFDRHLATHFE